MICIGSPQWTQGPSTDDTSRTSCFTDAVVLAANLGYDADTTAAITGQLAGAIYGAGCIMDAWKNTLAWSERIAQSACQLFAAGVNR